MDYPGDLYFFLNRIASNDRILYAFGIIIMLIILTLGFFSGKQHKQYGAGSLRKIILSSSFYLFLISAFILVMRIPSLLLDEQGIDESFWIAGSSAFIESPRLWTSFNTTTSGPLVMLPLILIKLTGLDLSYASVRLGGILFCIIPSIIFSYYTFRILLEEKIARILILPLAAFFAFINVSHYIAYNGEHMIILFTSMALLLHTKLLMGNKRRMLLLLYAIAIGCLPFTKLQALPIGIALGLVMLAFMIKEKTGPGSYLLLLLGGIIPSSVILLWILITGEFNDFWIPYIMSNLNYGQSGTGVNGSSWLYFKYFVYLLRTLPDSRFYFISIFFFSLFLGTSLIFLRKLQRKHFFFLVSTAGLLLASYYAIVKTSFFYPHYFLIAIIPASFTLVILISIFSDAFQHTSVFKPVLIIFSILCLTILILDWVNRMAVNPAAVKQELKKTAAAQAICKYGKEDERMAIWGWNAALYVQTGLIPGTRYADCYPQIKKSPLQEYYINTYLEDLKKNKPLIFADAITPKAYEFNSDEYKHQNFPIISNYIRTNYRKVEEVDGIEIFILKEK
jgi:hypothetical protein